MPAYRLLLAAPLFIATAHAGDADLSRSFNSLSDQINQTHQALKASAQEGASPMRSVHLSVYVCAGTRIDDQTIAQDIARANRAFSQCRVGNDAAVSVKSFQMENGRCNLQRDEDSPRFSADQKFLISQYPASTPGALTAFYMNWNSQNPAQSGTSNPVDYVTQVKSAEDHATQNGAIGMLFIFQQAREQNDDPAKIDYTLAHEMGHVLTGDSSHSPDPGNLMYSTPDFAADSPPTLTPEQCAKISAYARSH